MLVDLLNFSIFYSYGAAKGLTRFLPSVLGQEDKVKKCLTTLL